LSGFYFSAGDKNMTTIPPESFKVLEISLLIAQYPILASRIRREMRQELFRRGIVTSERFAQEVKEKAVLSQQREGLLGEGQSEDAEQWHLRFHRVQRTLTDFYFAYNLPIELLQKIVNGLLGQNKAAESAESSMRFIPELAPLEMVLRQAETFESLAQEERESVAHQLQELRVVLLKSMVSDQLAFIHIAKEWFTTADFHYILEHRIGTGKVGGKAAGLLLAYKILENTAPEIFEQISIPRSYFIGANVFYDFIALNNVEFVSQKYKSYEQIRSDYPDIQEKYARARFPEEIAEHLRAILSEAGRTPLIVRSSSLLEDNFGTSFAGKYASFFCPNQGTEKENLRDLTLAIRRVYASVFSPEAITYRRRMGLLDYDERMAILLQEVQGQRHRNYFFPAVAGMAYSYSPFVWNPRLRREDGFTRIVMGLGTRAVDRTGSDYPRMVNLSHPQLRPEVTPKDVRYYSQRYLDLIDIEKNSLVTESLENVLGVDLPSLRWMVSVDDGDTVRPPVSLGLNFDPSSLVLTFDGLLQRSEFVPLLKTVLSRLAHTYQLPVDVEFAVSVSSGEMGKPRLDFHLLQCRPQTRWKSDVGTQAMPENLLEQDKIFVCTRMVPQGYLDQIEYIVYIDPESYRHLDNPRDFTEVARLVGQLNKMLEGRSFILIGPGRWGSSDAAQGVPVTYADIFNSRALVELTSKKGGYASEPSYGTHFFQDLVETKIYPLAISTDSSDDHLNLYFIHQAANKMADFFAQTTKASDCIKLIHVPTERPNSSFEVMMDGERGTGYIVSLALLKKSKK
jgi:hypothetical protein